MRRASLILILFLSSFYSYGVNIEIQADGKLYTTLQNYGNVENRYDIVFLGDGFTLAEQQKFNERVMVAIAALKDLDPYSSNMCAFNIWRVNVVSSESGVDHPLQNIFKNTELDCTYGIDVERAITSNDMVSCYEAASVTPSYDAIFVLVNDDQWGGSAGSTTVFSSISPPTEKHPGGFAGIITHELGHQIGWLADEYKYLKGIGIDDNLPYPYTTEPAAINVTLDADRDNPKWGYLVLPQTPVPTPDNIGPNVVGFFEGGSHYAKGIYRPELTCHMKVVESGFCAVCMNQMNAKLSAHCPDCSVETDNILCLIAQLKSKFFVKCACPLRCILPPVCLTCPWDGILIKDWITIENSNVAISNVHVYDDMGKEVKSNIERNSSGTITISFTRNRFLPYSVEFTPTKIDGTIGNASFEIEGMSM